MQVKNQNVKKTSMIVLIIPVLDTDIIKFSPELGEQFPQLKLISKLPRVNVETVVKAVLTLMEDETRNGT